MNTPIEICEERDVKGLYDKARQGLIKDFTGVNSPFESPQNADLILFTKGKRVEENVDEVFNFIKSKINK